MQFWKKNEKVFNVVKGLLVSYVISAVLLLFLAFLLYKFSLPKQVIGIGVTAVYIVSTFIGGFLLGKHMKVKKFLWGLAIGMGYFFPSYLYPLKLLFNIICIMGKMCTKF